MTNEMLLSVSNVSKTFEKPLNMTDSIINLLGGSKEPERVRAVDDVSFSLRAGEALGLVGESGCGKSTMARMVLNLLTPSTGSLQFRNKSIPEMSNEDLLKIQMVFQDPYSSLNPRMRMNQQIGEAIRVHEVVPRDEQKNYMEDIFGQCGIDISLSKRYPHQFSGGQRQRYGIARALAMKPDLVVCDEPVAALDVSIQAQIINLFSELRRNQKMAYLFISHDLSVVQHLCDRVAVMYLGRIVEEGPVDEVLGNPKHPYTQALKASSPKIRTSKYQFEPIVGEIPSPLHPPSGCHFHPRCPHVKEICKTDKPQCHLVDTARSVSCHLID